jgi:hypothetical protein
MSETHEHASVRQGVVAHSRSGAVGGVGCYVDDEGHERVILALAPSEADEEDRHLRQGETFRLGDEVWEVSEIQSAGAPHWGATLTRVS